MLGGPQRAVERFTQSTMLGHVLMAWAAWRPWVETRGVVMEPARVLGLASPLAARGCSCEEMRPARRLLGRGQLQRSRRRWAWAAFMLALHGVGGVLRRGRARGGVDSAKGRGGVSPARTMGISDGYSVGVSMSHPEHADCAISATRLNGAALNSIERVAAAPPHHGLSATAPPLAEQAAALPVRRGQLPPPRYRGANSGSTIPRSQTVSPRAGLAAPCRRQRRTPGAASTGQSRAQLRRSASQSPTPGPNASGTRRRHCARHLAAPRFIGEGRAPEVKRPIRRSASNVSTGQHATAPAIARPPPPPQRSWSVGPPPAAEGGDEA